LIRLSEIIVQAGEIETLERIESLSKFRHTEKKFQIYDVSKLPYTFYYKFLDQFGFNFFFSIVIKNKKFLANFRRRKLAKLSFSINLTLHFNRI